MKTQSLRRELVTLSRLEVLSLSGCDCRLPQLRLSDS